MVCRQNTIQIVKGAFTTVLLLQKKEEEKALYNFGYL